MPAPIPERQIREYLDHTLGVQAEVVGWHGDAKLPAFLKARYRFARMHVLGRDYLLMVDHATDPEPPGTVQKHIEQVRTKWDGPVVFVRAQVTAFNRKRLIERRIPFIVPGNQLYLPELGLDLREYFRAPPPSKRRFRPATQAVLIFELLNPNETGATAAVLAPALGYSAMTLSRAFDELESFGLATSEAIGRERVLRFMDRTHDVWKRAQPWLIDPVQSRNFTGIHPGGLHAGEDALARSTMLAEPRLPVMAISHKQWLAFMRAHVNADVPDHETAVCEVEVWKYEPRAYRLPGVVDPLSLFLSLRQAGDERVEQARDSLMEQVPW